MAAELERSAGRAHRRGGAIDAFSREERGDQYDSGWLLACRIAPDLWDDEAWHHLAAAGLALARDAAALTLLPIALHYRAGVHVHAGEFAAAAALVNEADRISEATGTARFTYTSLVLAGWRGNHAEALRVIRASGEDATARGEGRVIALAEYASAVLHNGLGRYEDAVAAAQRGCADDDLGLCGWSLVELIEAAARHGQPDVSGPPPRVSRQTRAGCVVSAGAPTCRFAQSSA